MTITVQNNEGIRVHYDSEYIEYIGHYKAKDIYNRCDLEGNGIKPQDSIMIIKFKNGSSSTFGSSWRIIF